MRPEANHDHSVGVFAPGTRLGRFEVERLLAFGGMAEIYLAKACGVHGFQKPVVLKRIPPHLVDNAELVTMFLDEARIAATLNHPNIGQVYDIGVEGDSCYFAMEFIHGRDVRHIMRARGANKGGLPLELALAIVKSIAQALHAAHTHCGPDGTSFEIVHRDVSPGNVLVGFDGNVKLIDFGIAKAAQRQTATRTGVVKGKYAYMSPEQCRGGNVDRRSDIFSLGIMLYELTTGRPLFAAENDYLVMRKVLKEPIPRPSAAIHGYPDVLERVVMKALDRDPNKRYSTALEMYRALESVVRGYHLFASQYELADYMRDLFPEAAPPTPQWAHGSHTGCTNTESITASLFASDDDFVPTQRMSAVEQTFVMRVGDASDRMTTTLLVSDTDPYPVAIAAEGSSSVPSVPLRAAPVPSPSVRPDSPPVDVFQPVANLGYSDPIAPDLPWDRMGSQEEAAPVDADMIPDPSGGSVSVVRAFATAILFTSLWLIASGNPFWL